MGLSGIKIKIKMTDAVPDSWMKMFRLPEFTISNIERIICGINGACRKNNPDNIQYIFRNYGPGGPGRNSKEPNPDSGTDGTEPGPYESKEPGPYESKEPGPGEDKCYCKSQCGCDEEGAIRGEIEYGYKRTKGRPTAHRRRKREDGDSVSSYVNFVRTSSCKSDLECQEAFSSHLKRH